MLGRARTLLVLLGALPVVAAPDAATLFTATPGLLRAHTSGVMRPDEGTIEIVTALDRPLTELGSGWDFLFKIVPAVKIGQGANTLVGAFVPALPERGLAVLLRNARDYYRVDLKDFAPPPGEPFVLAFTWGSQLQVYLNGRLQGATPMRAGLDEALLPDQLTVDRFAPFQTTALRVSTRARGPAELLADPRGALAADDDTALLAIAGLTQVRYGVTTWHRQSGYACLRPAWRPEQQVQTAGEHLAMPFIGLNHGAAPRDYAVRCAITDRAGQPVAVSQATITIPPDGQRHVAEVPLPLARSGWYRVQTTVTSAGATAEYRGAVSVVPPLTGRTGRLAGYYGQHYDWDGSFTPFQRIGVRSTRTWAGGSVFLWHRVQPAPDRFEWARADAFVAQCRAAGVEVLGVLGYPPRWAAVEPPQGHQEQHVLARRPERWAPRDRAEWARYVFETVQRYRGQVAVWEIYNEVNFSPPGPPATFAGSTEDYLELLKLAYAEAKRADPACRVAISGFSADVNRAMPTRLLALGALDHCDIFNVHGYSGVAGVADWVADQRARKPAMPVWQTEQMWHQLANEDQRLYLTVAYLVDFLAAGYERYYHMGTTEIFFDRYTGAPTPDFQVLAAFQDQLGRCDRLVGRYTFPGCEALGLRHQFARSDGRTLSLLGSEMAAHEVTCRGRDLAAWDLLGQPVEVASEGDAQRLLVPSAVYVVSDGPLTIAGATARGAVPLLTNVGFEEVEGDVTMGGLRAGRPRSWLARDRAYDPGGAVTLSDAPHAGRYAQEITSTGAGRVYTFQYTKAFVPGRYRISAHLRRAAGDAALRPYAFWYDIEHERIENHVFEGVGDEYRRFTWEVDLPATGKLAIGFGLNGGAGRLLLDDVGFEPVGE